ncbi:uncharacterized protein LOC129606479 [Condylostylus longicornis]|uniref:uncharacterized protein LOC129606479 n=1 Tax=Condylostylus longicornis TaxID=2530218 RepID=UPI00244DE8AE|nr:uncharacterized protein LOC129606479 [Condylostylus longicornis]
MSRLEAAMRISRFSRTSTYVMQQSRSQCYSLITGAQRDLNQLKKLNGAINAQIEQSKRFEIRLAKLEAQFNTPQPQVTNLAAPKSEDDLKQISRLPDCVKDLQTFDGDAVQYVSWVHSVESILRDYEVVRNKPIYRAILQAIRGKIRGRADAALISYNLFDEEWAAIKQCLSLHYADKRDIRTLEHQMSTLTQGRSTIDEFYARVNHQFSLIINKIKTENYTKETIDVLIESQRNRALDVFIRGLNGELSRYLMLQKPSTLPEAYSTCLELQNYSCRNFAIHNRNDNNRITVPFNKMSMKRQQPSAGNPRSYQPEQPLTVEQRNLAYNIQHQRESQPPPRPPKPLEKMDVDRSIQTRQVNYMNRPDNYRGIYKRPPSVGNMPSNKHQRLFNMETLEDDVDDHPEECSEYDEEPAYADDEVQELLKFLVDTGANKNFVREEIATNAKPTTKPFKIRSAGGDITITKKIGGRFFQSLGNNTFIEFFVLPGLKTFDGIIGDDTLKKLEAIIDRKNNTLRIKPDIKIPLKAKASAQVNTIEIGADHLPKAIQEKIMGIIRKYEKIFGPINDREIIDTQVKAEIKTTTDDPIYTKSYPYPANMRKEVEEQIKKLLEDGIIRPSKSPYNSPIWVVAKKPDSSGVKKYRMVIDFKRLNAVTVPDTYPIPDITSTLASLGQAKFFTTLDLTSGFHQIMMHKKDIPKTAFSTMNGKYEFLRLPFGLRNAPSIFQRMIDDVLKDQIGKSCYVYIDDVIIYGKTEEEHLRNIETIFSILEKANLKVNLEKTKFFNTETEFLGYIVTSEGIKPDPRKVAAIQNIMPPTNLKDLKSFLGLTSYYRRFIQDFAKVAKPLTSLTRGENAQIKANQSKKVGIKLNAEELKAFNRLKELLISSEVLIFPNFEKPFILTTDASDTAIGAVLSQGAIATIKQGQGQILEGNFNLVHIIDLKSYDEVIQQIIPLVDGINSTSIMKPQLEHQLAQIMEFLTKLRSSKSRVQRSINWIGTAWKWLAGTPDATDWDNIVTSQDKLIQNNNQQYKINREVMRITNQVVERFNHILEHVGNLDHRSEQIIFNKLGIIKEALGEIVLATELAKNGIVNTNLLSRIEIQKILKEIDTLPYVNEIEAIEYAKPQVVTNGREILYILSIPKTGNQYYDHIIARSTIRNSQQVYLEYQELLVKDDVYGISTKCENLRNITICERTLRMINWIPDLCSN